ncbi:Uncharacterised protein [Serratia marcescens]|nr:hypothetical protein AF53_00774 [Serratia marcescens BIDMC 80]KMJ07245.1 hypothetical protein SN05_01405 [Serratia marcescens]ONK17522.1 hypothetical protein BHT35_3124 [Serratia sp. S119]CVD63520.1 Uncharacterised protein [Serratia sp. 2880STDY5682895]OUI57264.1 hypothetical protein AZZ98_001096 [Serratia marcescens]
MPRSAMNISMLSNTTASILRSKNATITANTIEEGGAF